MRTVGVVLLVVGLVPLAQNAWTVLTGERATARIAHVVRESNQEAPVLEFRTQDGRQVSFQGSFVRGRGHYTVGQSLPVVYRPSPPHHAEVDSFWMLWSGAALVILGATIIAFPPAPKLRRPAAGR